jgi:hypothetical protein
MLIAALVMQRVFDPGEEEMRVEKRQESEQVATTLAR